MSEENKNNEMDEEVRKVSEAIDELEDKMKTMEKLQKVATSLFSAGGALIAIALMTMLLSIQLTPLLLVLVGLLDIGVGISVLIIGGKLWLQEKE